MADGWPILRRGGRHPAECPRICQRRLAVAFGQSLPAENEPAQPHELLPDLDIEPDASMENALRGQAIGHLRRQSRSRVQPRQHLIDALTFGLSPYVAQRKDLQIQQLGSKQHHLAWSTMELALQLGQERGLSEVRLILNPAQHLTRRGPSPGHDRRVDTRRFSAQSWTEHIPSSVLDLRGPAHPPWLSHGTLPSSSTHQHA